MTLQREHTIYREAIRWKDIDIIFIQMARNENLESKSKKKNLRVNLKTVNLS